MKQVKVHVLDHMDAIVHAWEEDGYELVSSDPIESSRNSIGCQYFMFNFQKKTKNND